MRTEVTEAFILRVVNYAEKDRIVTMLVRELGIVAAFARGARASTKRFSGGLELFRLYRVTLRMAPSRMPSLQAAITLTDLPGMSSSLERIAVGSCALELVRGILQEGEPQDHVFDGVCGFLEAIHGLPVEDRSRLLLALRWLELQILASQGLEPELGRCYRCRTPVEHAFGLAFSAGGGGLICRRCVEPQDLAVPLERVLVGGLHRLLEQPLEQILASAAARRVEGNGTRLSDFVEMAGRLTRQLIEAAVTSPLKAYAFLDGLPPG